jgi:hypothetical protein
MGARPPSEVSHADAATPAGNAGTILSPTGGEIPIIPAAGTKSQRLA